jgi:hypothetical protein
MSQTITKKEFYTVAKILTKDAFAFLETDLGKDMAMQGAPAYQYKYVHIEPRRQIGKTYAASLLAADYAPSLFVFHSQDWKLDAIRSHYRYDYCPTNIDFAYTADEILAPSFFHLLGNNHRVLSRQLSPHRRTTPQPKRFKLGIIDDGMACLMKHGQRKMDEVRDRMFLCCDIIVEFG